MSVFNFIICASTRVFSLPFRNPFISVCSDAVMSLWMVVVDIVEPIIDVFIIIPIAVTKKDKYLFEKLLVQCDGKGVSACGI